MASYTHIINIFSTIFFSVITGLVLSGCFHTNLANLANQPEEDWHTTVANQVKQLGHRNWIVIAEASFPAHNKPGFKQITTTAEVPEVIDHVLNSLEKNQYVLPRIYTTREMRAVENNFSPGIETLRKDIQKALHAYEPTELEQKSLITLIESANQRFNVLVIRTPTALPYSSVFMELQPGYWDAESEYRLRKKIGSQNTERLAPATP